MTRIKAILSKALAVVYPPSKAKFHRLLHWLATAAAIGASVCVWLLGQKWGWSTWNQIEAQALLVSTYLARVQALFKRLDGLVDELPIPDELTQPQPKGTDQ